jgi:hypothetical protein
LNRALNSLTVAASSCFIEGVSISEGKVRLAGKQVNVPR